MADDEFSSAAAIAQEAARDLLADVDVQEQLVAREHDLKAKLFVWDNIIKHLNTLVAENTEAHRLLLGVVDNLSGIRDLIGNYEIEELRLMREENSIVQQIGKEVRHRNWKLVRVEKQSARKKAKKYEKLEMAELEKLKEKFFELSLMIEKSSAININPSDTRISVAEFIRKEEYYFLQIRRFAFAYFSIIADLLTKEELLLKSTN